jgi:hypothetical protein
MSPSSGNEYNNNNNNNNNDQDNNNNNTSRRLSGEFNNTFDSFPASDVGGPQAPGSPSKSSAFYDYKQTDTGAILADEAKLLKQSLRTKKAQLKAETLDTNSLTREIRGLTGAIQRKQLLREDQDKQGEVEVIDEEEFKLIQQCKQQKKAYAAVYTQRKLTVTQVEQLKVRSQDAKVALMNGFLGWYTDKYGEEDVAVEQQHNVAVVEDGDQLDDGEKFAALEERRIMDKHPESLSFYNAKKQMSSTLKKKKRLKGARKPLASSIRPRMK